MSDPNPQLALARSTDYLSLNTPAKAG